MKEGSRCGGKRGHEEGAGGSTLLLEHHGEREWNGALTNRYLPLVWCLSRDPRGDD